MKPKVFVAMSGGVDSTACAVILRSQGFEVAGITIDMGPGDAPERAAKACAELEMEHFIINLRQPFAQLVQRPFCEQYLAGRTPNPCVACNREIKFGPLMREAMRLGADFFATGHYARVEKGENGLFVLKKAVNAAKDQSYVLYSLTQAQLSRVLLPLGGLNKEQTRQIARQAGLSLAAAPDSQDICFVPGGDYARFIEDFTGKKLPEGNFVDSSGKILGRHRGIIHYTVGQRRGLGLSAGEPYYVLSKNPLQNTVVLGFEGELMRDCFAVGELCLHVDLPFRAAVRTRYHQRETACEVLPLEEARAKVILSTPARAPAPGQSAVFYDGDVVLGGGIVD